ncbi:X-ray repair cross-complementing protein 5 [Trichoplax sp. H2]|nr:X-ray repair cross-complementing protein 5 [Trichoplax sp. H2]|eukprot:RDD39534.1 X-ray repair cross-complementing protein 5 [Trichoplax sp. H2]
MAYSKFWIVVLCIMECCFSTLINHHQEAIAICLDVSPSMCYAPQGHASKLETSVNAINMIVSRKMFSQGHLANKDEFALVLFGTQARKRIDNYIACSTKNALSVIDIFVHCLESDNDLYEDGQYENISVVRPLGPPDLNFLRYIQTNIAPGDEDADFLDSIIVAMDLLKKSTSGKKFGDKRIILFSDLGSPFADDQVEAITEAGNLELMIAGESTLKKILEIVDGDSHSLRSALSTLSFFQKRSIKMTTVFRGPLEIGSKLKINTYAYIKVKIERSYHLNDEDETEIERENLAKGYKYGKTIVPWLKIDEESMKLKAAKCLSVLGFTKSENVKRHWLMGDGVVVFMPAPNDEPAGVAFSALVQALYETDKVAVVRYVYRNNSQPKLGILFPQIKATYRSLLFIQLPFMEDIRQYTFASLTTNKKNVPTDDQLDLVDDLVTSMDLSRAYRDDDGELIEALKPKLTFNPVLQRSYQCIQHRALNPDDALPRPDPVITRYLSPSQDVTATCASHFQKIKDSFGIVHVQKKKKRDDGTAASIFKDNIDLALELDTSSKRAKDSNSTADVDFSISSLSKENVTEVGTVQPVQDFKAMINQKDEDRFEEACKQMKSRIWQLVMDSIGSQLFPKAMDCLKALREECVRLGEPAVFNQFLQDMKDKLSNAFGRDFWLLVVEGEITLISVQESSESDVTVADAKSFLKSTDTKVEDNTKETTEEDADDLVVGNDVKKRSTCEYDEITCYELPRAGIAMISIVPFTFTIAITS